MSFDRTDPVQLQELKDEVFLDPLALGYNPTGPDQDILDIINAEDFTVQKPTISSAEVRSVTLFEAFDGLVTVEQAWFEWLTQGGSIDEETIIVTSEIRQKLSGDPIANDSIWATADRTEMNAIMLSLMDVPGGRAEVLWGWSTVITAKDWQAARDS